MDFGWVLLHLASRFGAKCNAFWCILQCVLVQNAVRLGAKCSAFWCILQCVLVQNALQHQVHRLHFLVVVDANLGEISFKEKCKNIVNDQKW